LRSHERRRCSSASAARERFCRVLGLRNDAARSRGLVWCVDMGFGSPRRRASPGPPTGQALVVAEATLRKSPEPFRDNHLRAARVSV
jgi:hypothetical protein